MRFLVQLTLSSGDGLTFAVEADDEDLARIYLERELGQRFFTLPKGTVQHRKQVYEKELFIRIRTSHIVYYSLTEDKSGIKKAETVDGSV